MSLIVNDENNPLSVQAQINIIKLNVDDKYAAKKVIVIGEQERSMDGAPEGELFDVVLKEDIELQPFDSHEISQDTLNKIMKNANNTDISWADNFEIIEWIRRIALFHNNSLNEFNIVTIIQLVIDNICSLRSSCVRNALLCSKALLCCCNYDSIMKPYSHSLLVALLNRVSVGPKFVSKIADTCITTSIACFRNESLTNPNSNSNSNSNSYLAYNDINNSSVQAPTPSEAVDTSRMELISKLTPIDTMELLLIDEHAFCGHKHPDVVSIAYKCIIYALKAFIEEIEQRIERNMFGSGDRCSIIGSRIPLIQQLFRLLSVTYTGIQPVQKSSAGPSPSVINKKSAAAKEYAKKGLIMLCTRVYPLVKGDLAKYNELVGSPTEGLKDNHTASLAGTIYRSASGNQLDSCVSPVPLDPVVEMLRLFDPSISLAVQELIVKLINMNNSNSSVKYDRQGVTKPAKSSKSNFKAFKASQVRTRSRSNSSKGQDDVIRLDSSNKSAGVHLDPPTSVFTSLLTSSNLTALSSSTALNPTKSIKVSNNSKTMAIPLVKRKRTVSGGSSGSTKSKNIVIYQDDTEEMP